MESVQDFPPEAAAAASSSSGSNIIPASERVSLRLPAHLTPKLVHPLENLVPGSEPKPREKTKVLAHRAHLGGLLEDNLAMAAAAAACEKMMRRRERASSSVYRETRDVHERTAVVDEHPVLS